MTSDRAYDVFEQISQVSGNTKQSLLAEYPEVQSYLLACYDPYVKYYLTGKQFNKLPGDGKGVFTGSTWLLLEALHTRTISGDSAYAQTYKELKLLTPKSQSIFLRILNGDMRIGMGPKTINKVFKGLIPIHSIMLAKLFDKRRVKFPCYASPKLDGVRGTWARGEIRSRNGHPYKGLEHITKLLNHTAVEPDGELMIPGLSFQQSSGQIRSDRPSPKAKFYVFDDLESTRKFGERLLILQGLADMCEPVIYVPHKVIHNLEELMLYYDLCRSKGFEGAVVKPLNYKYKGTRSYDWMKMKPRDTLDLKVVGVYEGTGKYEGMLGGVRVEFNGHQRNGVGSGFSDYQRERFWETPSLIVGKIIEVDYMELTDDGDLRHSSFKCIREDKS